MSPPRWRRRTWTPPTTPSNERVRSTIVLPRSPNTVKLATETVRLAPLQRRERGRVERYSRAVGHAGYAVRNTRVLARAAVRAVELEPSAPNLLVASIRDLAVAVGRLDAVLDSAEGAIGVRESARDAAAEATASLEEEAGFAIGALVGQVRSIATDLLRALGLDQHDAVRLVRRANALREGGPPRATATTAPTGQYERESSTRPSSTSSDRRFRDHR